MADGQEVINFDDVHAPIYRVPESGCYIAFRPPKADPYVVASKDMEPQQIIEFVQKRIELIRSLRGEMIKRFEKSPSLVCRFRTGDVAYVIGRPLMIKVYPNVKGTMKKNSRGRVTISAKLDEDVSILNLFVMQKGDYDQCRAAFLAWAEGIYLNNMRSVMAGCRARVDEAAAAATKHADAPEAEDAIDNVSGADAAFDAAVADAAIIPGLAGLHLSEDPALNLQPRVENKRSLHGKWAEMNQVQGVVFFSRELIAYPQECSAYAYMAAISQYALPEGASEEERIAFIALGCPTWENARALLADENSIYARQ